MGGGADGDDDGDDGSGGGGGGGGRLDVVDELLPPPPPPLANLSVRSISTIANTESTLDWASSSSGANGSWRRSR